MASKTEPKHGIEEGLIVILYYTACCHGTVKPLGVTVPKWLGFQIGGH